MKGVERRIAVIIPVIIALMILIRTPAPVEGDGCYVPVGRFQVYEPGQFGLVCWNGTVERLYLSINIWGEGESDGVHFVPFPSLPDVSLGNISIFKNLTRVFERSLSQSWEWDREIPGPGGDTQGNPGSGGGYELEFEESFGVHDVTVIKVIDVDQFKNGINSFLDDMAIGTWPEGMDEIIEGYVARGFPYFAIDRFSIGKKPKDIEPIIYEFKTDKAIFPLEISSLLEGRSSIKIGCLVPGEIPIDLSGRNLMTFRSEGCLSSTDLNEISPGLETMFGSGCLALFFNGYLSLSELEGDFQISKNERADWMTAFRSYRTYSSTDDQGRKYERILTTRGHQSDGTDILSYIDPKNGKLLWERREDLGDHGSLEGRSLFLDDVDHDGREDIFITDHNKTCGKMTRLDPITGNTLWSTSFQSVYNGGIDYYKLMDPSGKMQIAIDHHKGIAVFDIDNGDLISRFYARYTYSWMDEVTILGTQSGDRIVFIDPYDSTFNVWDPWKGSQGDHLFCEKYEDGYWSIRDSFHLGGISYFISWSNDRTTVVSVNDQISVSMSHFGGNYLGWKEQNSNRNRPLGLFYTEIGIGIFEIFAVNLLDSSILWRQQNITSSGGSNPLEMRWLDINGDDTDEIVLNWFPYLSEEDEGKEMIGGISIHNENTGEVVWTSTKILVDLGTDSNRNGLNELLVEDIDVVILVEPFSDSILMNIPKDEVGLSHSFISGDLNSDGYDDHLIMTTSSQWYWSAPWKFIDELIFLDGFTRSCESFTIDLGAVTNAWGSSNDKGEDIVIVSTFRRLYSFPLESRIKLISDKLIVSKGRSTDLVITAANLNGPVTNASVEWDSDIEGGKFSKTLEIGAGMYSATWTSPNDFIGKVTLTVKVDNGDFSVGTQIFLEVIDGISIPEPSTTGIDVSVSVFPTRIIDGGVVSITASIEGDFLEENLNLIIYEILGTEEKLEMIRISDTLWTTRYWPKGPAGERILIFKVVIDEILIHEEYLRIMLLEHEETFVEERSLPTIKIGSSARTAQASSSIPIVVLVSGLDMNTNAMLRAHDHGSGGSFTQFSELFPGVWSANYSAPGKEGAVMLTVFIEMYGQKLVEDSYSFVLLQNDTKEPIAGELVLHHRVFDHIENGEIVKYILISPLRNGLQVLADLEVVFISNGSWHLEENYDRIGNTIHLKVIQDEEVQGFLFLDVTDGQSITSLHINLDPIIQAPADPSQEISTEEELETDDIKLRDENNDDDDPMINIILTITLICFMIMMGVMMFIIYRYKIDNNV